jgi:hypothetical protein
MSTSEQSDAQTHLAALGVSLFGTEDAVGTQSGATALLALGCCLGRPGTHVLLPGWMCSGVFYALLLAGLRPVPVDIDQRFALSLPSAEQRYTSETSLLIYAPFGGYAPDVAAWIAWARQRDLLVIADLVQSPDPALWRALATEVPALLTSFRPGKPLGAGGGGLIAGRQPVVEAARTFLNGGLNRCGQKVSPGIELPLAEVTAAAACRRLAEQPALLAEWRSVSAEILHSSQAACLPGWSESPYGLSKIPLLQRTGPRLNPDMTYRCAGWKQALFARYGVHDDTVLTTLDELYNSVTIRRVDPYREGKHNDGVYGAQGTGSAGTAGAQ